MAVDRHLPTDEAAALLELTRELARDELAPKAAAYEAGSRFPREVFRTLGKSGLLGLPYPEEHGGGGQPYEVYLQVVEELATVWATVAEGVSVHTLACFPLAEFGTDEQRARWLPDMIGGELLGAYCLSEPQSGSDAAALVTRAVRDGDDYVVNGTKAWITHGGEADFYSLLCRTSDEGSRGISCLLVDGATPGAVGRRRRSARWASRARPTAQVSLDGRPDRRRPAARRRGPGLQDRAGGAGRRPPRHRRVRGRPGPGRAGRGARLRPGARAVRPADPRLPGPRVHAGRHGDRRSRPAARSTSTRPGAATGASRSARRPRWPSCSAPTWRCASPPTPSRCSAATATSRTTRSSATCARPRRCRSSRAPTRSSAWSSAGTWPLGR